jgi:putative PIN family toxin of toxin-antitoxin system
MRLVLDTNVLISALWKPGSVPDQALIAAFARGATVLYDARIVAEYRTVLARPKFKRIDPARTADLIARLVSNGEEVTDVPAWEGALPDDDDRLFVEVALAGSADAIITGNLRDYPETLGVSVLPPASLLAMLEST